MVFGRLSGEAAFPLPRLAPASLIKKSFLFLMAPQYLPLAPVHEADASGGKPGLRGRSGDPGSEGVSYLGEASWMPGGDTASDRWGDEGWEGQRPAQGHPRKVEAEEGAEPCASTQQRQQ